MTAPSWEQTKALMLSYVGFVEGPNNANPFGPEQGVSNAAYCCSFAHILPYRLGYRWPTNCQFGEKGDAYCPYAITHGQEHGEVVMHPNVVRDLIPRDQVFFSWGLNGVADHVETVIAVYADGTFDTVGANTGTPEGVHAPIRRDAKYLLARRRPGLYTQPQPVPDIHGQAASVDVSPTGHGYNVTASDGGVFCYGDFAFQGSAGGLQLSKPIVGSCRTATGRGYWLVAADGGVFSFGDATFWGSMGGKPLAQPVVAMAATPTGRGYWLAAADGGIFAFGDAKFYGSLGSMKLNKPVVDVAVTPTGQGYWMTAQDGGVFALGDAKFFGAPASVARPVTSITPTASGLGYWLAAEDGGVFAYGDAGFMGRPTSANPIVDLAVTPSGHGYILCDSTGAIFPFGDATSLAGSS